MRGDWPQRLFTTAQALVGGTALLGIAAWTTLNPTLLLTFLFVQPALLVGVVLFVVASLFGRKAMLAEHFRPGAVVHHAGSGSRFVYVVQSGRLEAVRIGADGTEAIVRTFEPGQVFGGDASTPDGELPPTVRAVTPVALLRVSADDLATLVASVPDLRAGMERVLHDRLRGAAAEPSAPVAPEADRHGHVAARRRH